MKLKKLTNLPRISIIIPFTLVITASLIFFLKAFSIIKKYKLSLKIALIQERIPL